MEAMVPALLLQPLVENSVRHAILPRAIGGRVVVCARTDSVRTTAKTLILTVDDDGPGMQKSASPTSGVGLSNTATRLSVMYGGAAEFSIRRSGLGGVGVTIRLPLRTDAMVQSNRLAVECEA
jgi:LytS/YehU family sensor histidine kinase